MRGGCLQEVPNNSDLTWKLLVLKKTGHRGKVSQPEVPLYMYVTKSPMFLTLILVHSGAHLALNSAPGSK